MEFIAEEDKIELDLHGLNKDEAIFEVLECLDLAPTNIKKVIVVHGYSGKTLLKAVRNEIKHPRIEKMKNSINPGATNIYLKKEYNVSLEKKVRKKHKKKKNKKEENIKK